MLKRKSSSPRSIRRWMILPTLALVVPSILVAGYSILESFRNQRSSAERQLMETAKALSLVVDRQLGQSESLLKGLATSPSLQRSDFTEFYAQAKSLKLGPNRWITMARIDGSHVVNTYLVPGTPMPRSVPPLEYAPYLAQGKTHVSNLITSVVQDQKVLSVVVPVFTENKFNFALSIVMLPSAFNNILADQQLPSTWTAAILDREGTLVARSRAPERFVGQKATPDMIASLKHYDQAVMESTSLDGIRSLAAYRRSTTWGWTVIVGAPKNELLDSSTRLLFMTGSVLFLLLATGITMSVLIGRTVIRSVDGLVENAHQIGRGEVPVTEATGILETDQIAAAMRESAVRLSAREADLKRLNETLELRVQERTSELAEANRLLSISNRELQDFAHVASHDLQEPLRGTYSFAKLLYAEFHPQLNDTGRFYLERIQVSMERMRQLINDILTFSSVSSDRPTTTVVDLNKTLSEVLADLNARITASGGRIEFTRLANVKADAFQMHQLLLNLVGNGLKFQRAGVKPLVKVSTEETADLVKIIVEDNGIGFDETFAERIFSPFERLNGRDKFEGTGIGLAIVRRIVERHGGTVSATSVIDRGSRFEAVIAQPTRVT